MPYAGIFLIVMILAGFVVMTKGWMAQEVTLPILALVAVALAADDEALRHGFSDFSRVLLLFSSVAVPAKQLRRAGALDWVGLLLGEGIGMAINRFGRSSASVVSHTSLIITWAMAALCHNTTSILVCAQVIMTICEKYGLPARPILCGALVASNLGGFSTRWGDTPNIKEAAIWKLQNADFLREILPINFILLIAVGCAVAFWIKRAAAGATPNRFQVTLEQVNFRRARRELTIDKRLLWVGMTGLAAAILGPWMFSTLEVTIAAVTIVLCVQLDRPKERIRTMTALGIETYSILAAIFVLAYVLTNSRIGFGDALQQQLRNSGMSIWAIAITSYFGTLFTEAASWASAAAQLVHDAAPTHGAAWALGGGICAGSSSLVTAASAGILLSRETKDARNPSYRIDFGTYVRFGLTASLGMLIYYIIILSLIYGTHQG